jgi:hypothetical protein
MSGIGSERYLNQYPVQFSALDRTEVLLVLPEPMIDFGLTHITTQIQCAGDSARVTGAFFRSGGPKYYSSHRRISGLLCGADRGFSKT